MSGSATQKPRKQRRGPYASTQDVFFLHALIEAKDLASLKRARRPRFFIHDKEYQFNEVARYKRRAEIKGEWPQGTMEGAKQPSHIRIVYPPALGLDQTNYAVHAVHTADNSAKAPRPASNEVNRSTTTTSDSVYPGRDQSLDTVISIEDSNSPFLRPHDVLVSSDSEEHIVNHARRENDCGCDVSNSAMVFTRQPFSRHVIYTGRVEQGDGDQAASVPIDVSVTKHKRPQYTAIGDDIPLTAQEEAMYRRTPVGRTEALGAEHMSTLNTLNNLGLLYYAQGKLAKAEAMYKRALAGKEKALGAEHTSTLETVNNLGNLYEAQGKLAQAEAMYERALAGKEKALGAEHTSTLETVNNLGKLYCKQGKLAEAEAMYEQALAGKEKALGAEHPSILDTLNDLGLLYYAQDGFAKAEAMYERALAGKEKALGAEHIHTIPIA
jgi:Tfp pilus assembly protein PilF